MTFLVGIAGGSGSGKTTVAQALAEGYRPGQVQIIPLDAYYRDRQGMPFEERTQINYDHPEAFDEPLLLEQLAALKDGQAIDLPLYDYAKHERKRETIRVEPARVVILEGILVLAMESVLPLLDLKLFVDTEADLRFLRRMRRDVAERGRTVDSVCSQFLETVRPMHRTFIQPTRRHADLILPGEGEYETALSVLKAWVEQALG